MIVMARQSPAFPCANLKKYTRNARLFGIFHQARWSFWNIHDIINTSVNVKTYEGGFNMKSSSNMPAKSKNVAAAIIIAALLLVAGAIAAVAMLNFQKQDDETAKLEQEPSSNVPKEDVYLIASFIELDYNNSNPQTMAEMSDGIAIVKVKSLDGVSNYGKGVQQYVHPYTYGQIEVIQTLKGDIKEGGTVKFSRLGGIMPFNEYLEGLSETERAKFANHDTEKKVKITFDGDIDIEADKTYLVYLANSTVHYAEPGAYEIVGFEGGLREIQTASGYSVNSSSSDLKVLNNFTGEWENLNDVVKQGK